MKNGWIVAITKQGDKFDFRAGFFPRRVYYKREAEALAAEVREKGGEATYAKVGYKPMLKSI